MAFKMKGIPGIAGVKTEEDLKKELKEYMAGYEPPVKRSDLDAKGKALWDMHHAKNK